MQPDKLKTNSIFLFSAYGVVLTYLFFMPVTGYSSVEYLDKLLHSACFFLYSLLGYPLCRNRTQIGYLLVFLLIYGLCVELIQPFYRRESEWLDLLADLVGAIAGVMAAYSLDPRGVKLKQLRR